MAVIRLLGRLATGAALLFFGVAAASEPLPAQQASPGALDSARVEARSPATIKSPQVAAALGFVPGAGHLYAGDINRGWLIGAVYFTGFLIVRNGRTDTVGKVGGVMVVGGMLAGVVDGANAARRHNDRVRRDAQRP